MKTINSGLRVWLAVLLVSVGAVCAIWALPPPPTGGNASHFDDCWAALGRCNDKCTRQFRYPGANGLARQQCYSDCDAAFDACSKRTAAKAGGATVGQSPPPNAQGPNPNPTPTPTNPTGLPITGSPPPNAQGPNPIASPFPTRAPIFGPKPSPSPTANPILFDRPAQPTPTPTPKPHRKAIKKATPTPSPHGHTTSSAGASPNGHKPSPTPSPHPKSSPSPQKEEHHHHHS
jgi:hypothetical protein